MTVLSDAFCLPLPLSFLAASDPVELSLRFFDEPCMIRLAYY